MNQVNQKECSGKGLLSEKCEKRKPDIMNKYYKRK